MHMLSVYIIVESIKPADYVDFYFSSPLDNSSMAAAAPNIAEMPANDLLVTLWW